jgi:hypothetical protein
MTTSWTLPNTILQYSEPGAEQAHVSWDDSDNFNQLRNSDGRFLQSNSYLEHIARSPKTDIKNKTYFLKLTNFNFSQLPDLISGIEVRLRARRYGRATDDTIQLLLNDEVLGDNKATLSINPEKIYGGTSDIWGSSLTLADITDSSFGILIRFKSHPDWPHRDPILVDSVEMRIH